MKDNFDIYTADGRFVMESFEECRFKVVLIPSAKFEAMMRNNRTTGFFAWRHDDYWRNGWCYSVKPIEENHNGE